MINKLFLPFLAMCLTLAPLTAQAANDACFTDWTAASILVKAEGLVTLDTLTRLAPSKLGGDIVRSSLCETKNGFVYRLVVRTREGSMKSLSVDAKHPFDD